MRRLNKLGLDVSDRNKTFELIKALDQVLKPTGQPLKASDEMTRKVKLISVESEEYLAKHYGISW